MENILSQIFGLLVFVFVFASTQTQNIKRILLYQAAGNALGMLSYVLLGGFSGCGIYLIAAAQSVLFYFIRKSGKEEPRWLQPIIIVVYIGYSALAFRSLVDVFPMLAAVFCAIGLGQKVPTRYRIVMLLTGLTWIVYDLFVSAYTMLATHIFTVASALVGIIRFDILKRAQEGPIPEKEK